jgi:hypothetical protein
MRVWSHARRAIASRPRTAASSCASPSPRRHLVELGVGADDGRSRPHRRRTGAARDRGRAVAGQARRHRSGTRVVWSRRQRIQQPVTVAPAGSAPGVRPRDAARRRGAARPGGAAAQAQSRRPRLDRPGREPALFIDGVGSRSAIPSPASVLLALLHRPPQPARAAGAGGARLVAGRGRRRDRPRRYCAARRRPQSPRVGTRPPSARTSSYLKDPTRASPSTTPTSTASSTTNCGSRCVGQRPGPLRLGPAVPPSFLAPGDLAD